MRWKETDGRRPSLGAVVPTSVGLAVNVSNVIIARFRTAVYRVITDRGHFLSPEPRISRSACRWRSGPKKVMVISGDDADDRRFPASRNSDYFDSHSLLIGTADPNYKWSLLYLVTYTRNNEEYVINHEIIKLNSLLQVETHTLCLNPQKPNCYSIMVSPSLKFIISHRGNEMIPTQVIKFVLIREQYVWCTHFCGWRPNQP